MHEAARVAVELKRLLWLPHHAEQQVVLEEVRLKRADARRAVLAHRAAQREAGRVQPPFEELSEFGGGLGEFSPVHLVSPVGMSLSCRRLYHVFDTRLSVASKSSAATL